MPHRLEPEDGAGLFFGVPALVAVCQLMGIRHRAAGRHLDISLPIRVRPTRKIHNIRPVLETLTPVIFGIVIPINHF